MDTIQSTQKYYDQFSNMKNMKTKYRLRIDNDNQLYVNTDKYSYISYKNKLYSFFLKYIPKYYLFLEQFYIELINNVNLENKVICVNNINLISIIFDVFIFVKSFEPIE